MDDPAIRKYNLGHLQTQGGLVIPDCWIAYKTFVQMNFPYQWNDVELIETGYGPCSGRSVQPGYCLSYLVLWLYFGKRMISGLSLSLLPLSESDICPAR
jgi:hypothetical protein